MRNKLNLVYKIDGFGSFSETLLPKLRADLRQLSELKPWKSYLAIAGDWIIIILCFWCCITHPSCLSYLVAVLVISARQHALLALMHDGAHNRITSRKLSNDLVSDFFAAYPLFLATQAYRENHLQHHRYLNSDNDPDWVRKHTLIDWEYPMPAKRFVWVLGRYLLGFGLREWTVLIYRFSGFYKPKKRATKEWAYFSLRIAYYITLSGLLTGFHLWLPFLFLWVMPYFFIFQIIQRTRSIAEHFGLKHEHELNQTRNVIPIFLERYFFGPHNLGYHLDHHLYPSIPFYNLPNFHRVLCQFEEYTGHAHINDSYVLNTKSSLLNDLIQKDR